MFAAVSENTPCGLFGDSLANRRCSKWRAVVQPDRGDSERSEGKNGFGSSEQGSRRSRQRFSRLGSEPAGKRRYGSGTARREDCFLGSPHSRLTGPPSAKHNPTKVAKPGWPQSRDGRSRRKSCHGRRPRVGGSVRCDEHRDAATFESAPAKNAPAHRVSRHASQRHGMSFGGYRPLADRALSTGWMARATEAGSDAGLFCIGPRTRSYFPLASWPRIAPLGSAAVWTLT